MSDSDLLAKLDELDAEKKRIHERLIAEREELRSRLAAVEGALAKLGGVPQMVAGIARGRGRPVSGEHTVTGAIVAYVASCPGAYSRDIRAATGLKYPEVLGRLAQGGRLKRTGPSGAYQYWPADYGEHTNGAMPNGGDE